MKQCGFKFDTTYTSLPEHFFTQCKPEPVASPHVAILNHKLASSMGLDFSNLTELEQATMFAGLQLPKGATPYAQGYAGHQFGHFTMLGDGRAHLWGEHLTTEGKRFDIQFKGSGRTPYSRGSDGRAALGPMLREYIISEAMHYLRIPTTRSLAVATTGEQIIRETMLPGAMLTRVASSHIRVGTFEFAARVDDKQSIKTLMDYTVQRHYPELIESQNKALGLIKAVMERQANLIVHWMRVGFIHGVMNTDNMTLSGETIDYGPCAFMDAYDPMTVFSSIDKGGRYAYINQPRIAQWNLARLAETILPFIDHDIDQAIHLAEETINQFSEMYQEKWLTMMRSKLGLFGSQDVDEQLIIDLLEWMLKNHADHTNTFHDLSQRNPPETQLYTQDDFKAWHRRWQYRLKQNTEPFEASLSLMKKNNPVVIPRNHNVDQALKAAHADDLQPLRDLLSALEDPYNDRESLNPYKTPPQPSERVYQTFCGT